jgi:predicted RNase H-like HicB family nuclease
MISIGYPSTNTPPAVFIKIHSLPNNKLSMPIDIVVEPDEDGFFASAPDIPTLYGCGNTRTEAVEMLTREIESLYEDLIGGDQFTADWEDTKKYLMSRIIK